MMARVILLLLVLLVAAFMLVDPYTLHLNAKDVVLPAPLWQVSLGIADVGLLLFAAILVWKNQFLNASAAVAIETVFNLVLNVALVARDGLSRFIHGLGAQEYLSLYLSAIALRVLVFLALQQSAATSLRNRKEAGGEHKPGTVGRV